MNRLFQTRPVVPFLTFISIKEELRFLLLFILKFIDPHILYSLAEKNLINSMIHTCSMFYISECVDT